jgi:hypothetical protein
MSLQACVLKGDLGRSECDKISPQERQTQILDPLTIPDWDALIARHSAATVFHSQGWARTLNATYGHRPCYLGIKEGQAFKALLPLMEVDSWLTGRRGVSLPFTDCCAPLALPDDQVGMFRTAVRMGEERGWRHLEFRGLPLEPFGFPPSLSFLGHSLDLTRGEADLFNGFESSVRRAIRKAEKMGVKVSIGAELEHVRVYYHLHCRTRQRHGLPPQPFRFFQNLQRHLLATGRGFVVTARHHDQPIAAAVFLHSGLNAIYKFGASDFAHQQLRASNLVMWRGIQVCRQRHCRSLHFGRTGMRNEGLRRFKLGFGPEEHRMDYLRFDLRRRMPAAMRDRSETLFNRVFRLMPVGPARWVGAWLYPHAA